MIALREIYFFKANALAREIRQGNISEVLALNHFIVGIILSGIGYEVPLSVDFGRADLPTFVPFVEVIAFILVAIITYYGSWLAYQANRKGDGNDFFMRYAALSLPIGLQLVVAFFFVAITLVLVANIVSSTLGVVGGGLSLVLFYVMGLVFQCAFFLRLRACIYIASGA